MLKLITGVATLLLVVGAVIFTTWNGISVPAVRHSQYQGALRTYIDLAKARGQSQITKPAPLVEYVTNVKSLSSALKHYRLVVARPVEKRSVVAMHDEIRTWFKLQVTESLTPKKYSPCADCPRPASVPDELLPLGPDEILVSSRGGAVTVEGVEVVTPAEFDFQLSDSYLIFLEEDQSGLFGRIMVGPDAVFKVNPDESLSAMTEHPHMLKKIVKDQYKDSLRELKVAARNQQ